METLIFIPVGTPLPRCANCIEVATYLVIEADGRVEALCITCDSKANGPTVGRFVVDASR